MTPIRIILCALLSTACAPADDAPGEGDSSSGSESSDSGDPAESSGSDSSDDGSSSESEDSSTGEPAGCDAPGLPAFAACGSGCGNACEPGLDCRKSYAGGYLAECEATCEVAEDCGEGSVCSAGYCVLPCDADRQCPDGTFCYPGTFLDGTPIDDPAHPLAHCMPHEK